MEFQSYKFSPFLLILIVLPLLVSGCAQKDREASGESSTFSSSSEQQETSSAFSGGDENQETAENKASNTDVEKVETITEEGAQGGKTHVIDALAKKWEFLPRVITVKKGEKVRLNITSVDVAHGFSLPEFGVSKPLVPGQMTVVEFVADKTGTFDFFCSVYCGEGHGGMTGTLVVE